MSQGGHSNLVVSGSILDLWYVDILCSKVTIRHCEMYVDIRYDVYIGLWNVA